MTLNYRDLPLHIRRELEGQDAPTEATEPTEARTALPKARNAARRRKGAGRAPAQEAVEGQAGVIEGVLAGEVHLWVFRKRWNGVRVDLFVAVCGLSQHSEPKAAVGGAGKCVGCFKEGTEHDKAD